MAARPRLRAAGVGCDPAEEAPAAPDGRGAEVGGCDPDEDALHAAIERGAIDSAVTAVAELPAADIALVAVPVPALEETVRDVCAHLPYATVTDAGSTKRALVDAIHA